MCAVNTIDLLLIAGAFSLCCETTDGAVRLAGRAGVRVSRASRLLFVRVCLCGLARFWLFSLSTFCIRPWRDAVSRCIC